MPKKTQFAFLIGVLAFALQVRAADPQAKKRLEEPLFRVAKTIDQQAVDNKPAHPLDAALKVAYCSPNKLSQAICTRRILSSKNLARWQKACRRPEMLKVMVDTAKVHHVAAMAAADQVLCRRLRFTNSREGLERLVRQIQACRARGECTTTARRWAATAPRRTSWTRFAAWT